VGVPTPRASAVVELLRRHARRAIDLLVGGEGLPGECGVPEEPPPRLLQVEPARAFGDGDLPDARVLRQPGQDRRAHVADEVVGDEVQLPLRIRRSERIEELEVADGVARAGRQGHRLAVAPTRRPL